MFCLLIRVINMHICFFPHLILILLTLISLIPQYKGLVLVWSLLIGCWLLFGKSWIFLKSFNQVTTKKSILGGKRIWFLARELSLSLAHSQMCIRSSLCLNIIYVLVSSQWQQSTTKLLRKSAEDEGHMSILWWIGIYFRARGQSIMHSVYRDEREAQGQAFN